MPADGGLLCDPPDESLGKAGSTSLVSVSKDDQGSLLSEHAGYEKMFNGTVLVFFKKKKEELILCIICLDLGEFI